MPRSLTHSTKVHVRFNECDPLNIVWHGNYVKYFEDGREDFGRAYDFSYLELYNKNGVSVPLVHLEMDYKKSVSFGEEISVETTLIDDPAAKIVFEYKIFNGANQIVCTGKTIQVFLEMEKKELLITMPEFFETWKNNYLK
jgi:acyl-CoA thioester hydrolase